MHPLDLLEGLLPGQARRLFQRLLASGDPGLPVDELAGDLPPASVAGILGALTMHRLVTRHRVGDKIVYVANPDAVWTAAAPLAQACPRRKTKICEPRCAAVMTSLFEAFGEAFRADCPLIEEVRLVADR